MSRLRVRSARLKVGLCARGGRASRRRRHEKQDECYVETCEVLMILPHPLARGRIFVEPLAPSSPVLAYVGYRNVNTKAGYTPRRKQNETRRQTLRARGTYQVIDVTRIGSCGNGGIKLKGMIRQVFYTLIFYVNLYSKQKKKDIYIYTFNTILYCVI